MSLVLTASYVGVLYLFPQSRPSAKFNRDDGKVIKLRTALISAVTLASCVVSWRVYGTDLGLPRFNVGKALWLTTCLYLGPLFQLAVEGVEWEEWDVIAFRNYVVGPVTEELVFRACLIASLPWWSHTKLVFLSPLFFAVAHLHHGYENYLKSRDLPSCVLVALVQLSFTTVFGWYAAYLYLDAGSVYAPIAAHVFCNIMGLPDMSISRYNKLYRLLLVTGLVLFLYFIYTT